MKITEMFSPDLGKPSHDNQFIQPNHLHQDLLSQIESLIIQTENLSPNYNSLPETISSDLRQTLTHLTQLLPFPNSLKLHIWKLAYRLWNACIDISNAVSILPSSSCSSSSSVVQNHAKLRHIAADMLSLAGEATGVPSPAVKSASFYLKTGLIWHDLRKFDLASRTAWELSDRNLAITLLTRAKTLLFGSPDHYKQLANQYLIFGKSVLSRNNDTDNSLKEALKLMSEALDLGEKGSSAARTREQIMELNELRSKSLRFISAVHLQKGEYESVIKCVKVLREGNDEDHHASLPVLAMKAWLGLGRYGEAEKELRDMVVNKGIPESVWVSAVEAYFEAAGNAGAETVKGVFLGLLGRCQVSARAAFRVANRVLGCGGEGSRVRTKVVADLVSDERVVALFASEATAKERAAMHAVLWNCASEHFRSKDYETSAVMFEKSLLYISHDIENRILRAKGFRVLCLCYLGLSELDRAQEYINEAEKLEPNIACAFLKFKIYLQNNDHNGAINQVQAMKTCYDFTPDFLSLSAHEAVACHALPCCCFLSIQSPELLHLGKPHANSRSCSATNIDHDPHSKPWKREFLRLLSGFYGLVDCQEEENSIVVCKSLILSVSAMVASENQKKTALTDSEVKQAVELLDRAGKILTSISAGNKLGGDEITTVEPDLYFMHTFNAYDIHGRLDNCGPQQQLHFGPRSNPEVATFALNECLSALLSSPSPDYPDVALIVRRLIALASIHKGDSDDNAVHNLYKQAHGIMVGLKDGEYPAEEGKWLAMTAWNRAAVPVRLGQVDAAQKWMDAGLELARKVSGMETYRACMEDFAIAFNKKFQLHNNC
ncbi:hypothetical protein OIU84_016874 [Salix udensis]|uniref:Protein ZIP4 homolog n=1 Tax=Salix udensis TaxID=889485 RepID=A0AAD6JAT0_9ROSI|nr:hypothetical protein OIU84_016874 [Salix udensis]